MDLLKRALPSANQVLLELMVALASPAVTHALANPGLRNGTVTVEARIVNGIVTYVQPTVSLDLKVGTDVKVN